jgi:hypothetical protein
LYVGRRRDVETPAGSVALTDWDVLPFRLAPLLDQAASLTVVDPMSFPFDALRDSDRAIPVAVQLPGGWDAEQLIDLFGGPLLGELTPFDAVAVEDDESWGALAERYSWPAGIRATEQDLLGFAAGLAAESAGTPKGAKARYLAARTVLAPQLTVAREAVPRGETERVLLLVADAEPWASLFGAGAVVLAEADTETVHVALSINALCDHPREERATRLFALLQALRVGGRLIVLDRFLDGYAGRLTGAPAPAELLADVREASLRHVVLEHVETIRYPGEALASAGLFTFTKIGRPERP